MSLDPRLLQADELGTRLELVNGLAIREAQPPYGHQRHVERIARSIRPADGAADCGCVHALDVYIQFPNGLQRPDISILCREPPDEERDGPLTQVPDAVIEVVSPDYEARDLETGPPFYLSRGAGTRWFSIRRRCRCCMSATGRSRARHRRWTWTCRAAAA